MGQELPTFDITVTARNLTPDRVPVVLAKLGAAVSVASNGQIPSTTSPSEAEAEEESHGLVEDGSLDAATLAVLRDGTKTTADAELVIRYLEAIRDQVTDVWVRPMHEARPRSLLVLMAGSARGAFVSVKLTSLRVLFYVKEDDIDVSKFRTVRLRGGERSDPRRTYVIYLRDEGAFEEAIELAKVAAENMGRS